MTMRTQSAAEGLPTDSPIKMLLDKNIDNSSEE